jgi:hypothetical protein
MYVSGKNMDIPGIKTIKKMTMTLNRPESSEYIEHGTTSWK